MILLVNGEPLGSEKVLVTHGSSYHCWEDYISNDVSNFSPSSPWVNTQTKV